MALLRTGTAALGGFSIFEWGDIGDGAATGLSSVFLRKEIFKRDEPIASSLKAARRFLFAKPINFRAFPPQPGGKTCEITVQRDQTKSIDPTVMQRSITGRSLLFDFHPTP